MTLGIVDLSRAIVTWLVAQVDGHAADRLTCWWLGHQYQEGSIEKDSCDRCGRSRDAPAWDFAKAVGDRIAMVLVVAAIFQTLAFPVAVWAEATVGHGRGAALLSVVAVALYILGVAWLSLVGGATDE